MKKPTNFGERLRFARKLLGMKYKDLSKLSGVPVPTISNIERRGDVRSRQTLELAKALTVRPEWLATGEEPMVPQTPRLSPEALDLARQIDAMLPHQRSALRAFILSFGPAVSDERVAEFIKPKVSSK